MKQQEDKEYLDSSLPVLPRLDRLDFLLQVLEEKHGMITGKNDVVIKKLGEEEDDDHCRSTLSLSSALEEVHHKGTLVDRLSALEQRVLKLSLEMDEGNTSRSSSSKSRNDSLTYTVTRNDNEDQKSNKKEKQLQDEASTTSLSSGGKTDNVIGNAKMRRKSYRKWRLGSWLRLGCN